MGKTDKCRCSVCGYDDLSKIGHKRGRFFYRIKYICETCGYVFYGRLRRNKK